MEINLSRISAELIDFRRENSHLLELDRVYKVTFSSGIEAIRIDYRKQNSPESCLQKVGEVLILEGDTVYDLEGWTCEQLATVYETVLESMIDSFSPRILRLPEPLLPVRTLLQLLHLHQCQPLSLSSPIVRLRL